VVDLRHRKAKILNRVFDNVGHRAYTIEQLEISSVSLLILI
jgi:hypothetical protein